MTNFDNRTLPEGWAIAPLGEVADTSLGKMLDKAKSTGRHPVPYLRNINVQWGRVDLGDVLTMDIVPEEQNFFALRAGDLLVCEGGEVGRCAIWNGSGYMAFQKALHRVRPGPAVTVRYLRHYLEHLAKAGRLVKFATGSTIKHLPQERLREVPIILPPLAEQHRIVEVLEDHLSRLDAAMESILSARRRLRPFISSVLERAALGAPAIAGPEQALSGDSRHSLAGRTSKRFDYAGLPLLPEGWLWRVSSDVCEFIGSGSTPKAHMMHAGTGDIPFLKVYNITQNGNIDFTNRPTFIDDETHRHQLKRSRVLPGDVLTNIVGPPLGKTALVTGQYPEWNINQAIVAFRAGSEVLPGWLALVLRSPFVQGMLKQTAKATAGQFNIALSTCRELPLPIPPIAVQREAISQSTEQLDAGHRLARQISPAVLRAENLRRAVLRKAFAGQLVSQCEVDEPAAKFLGRISRESENRAEKSKQKARRRSGPKIEITADGPPPPAQASRAVTTFAVQQELPF